MKNICCLILIWIVCGAFSGKGEKSTHEVLLSNQISWELQKEESQLKLFARWIKNSNNEKTRQLKCISTASFSSDILKQELQNPDFTKNWLSKVESCIIETIRKGKEWNSYILFDFPWPMSKRDIVIKNVLFETEQELIIHMNAIKENETSAKEVTRMKGFYGYWKYNKQDGTFEYSIYSNVKSKIPTWATDPFIEQNIFSCISRLKDELEEISYSKKLVSR